MSSSQTRGSTFLIIGERTNVTGSPRFAKLILAGDYETALQVAREQGEGGANILAVHMDEGMLDGAGAAIRVDSSKWEVLEAALQCLQGKGLVNSISLKDGEAEFCRRARLVRR